MHLLPGKLILLITVFYSTSCSSVHFPSSNSGSSFFVEDASTNYAQTSSDQDSLQENGGLETVQERSAFDTPDVGSLSRGSDGKDTMYLKSRYSNERPGVIWPSNKQDYPLNRRKRSAPLPPLPPPFPFHLPPPFPIPPFPMPPGMASPPMPPGMAPPPMLPPPFPVPFSPKKTSPQIRNNVPNMNSFQRRQQFPQKENMESRNGLYIRTVPPKYDPPVNYAEDEHCVYHTLVNGDSEILLRKILPIRMRGRTLVRKCIPPIPDSKDPRYKVLLRGGQKHSYGNVNLSMKF